MKYLLIVCLLIISCYSDDTYVNPNKCWVPGKMKCENNKSYMCNYRELWEIYRNCEIIGQTCSMNPADTGGYPDIAMCIK